MDRTELFLKAKAQHRRGRVLHLRVSVRLCGRSVGRPSMSLHENCAPLGYYAADSGNFLGTFRELVDKKLPVLMYNNQVERSSHLLRGLSLK